MVIYPEYISSQDLIFKTDSVFVSLTLHENDIWNFSFANGIDIQVEGGFWRLLRDKKIVRVSSDHEQQFGLPAPINLVLSVTEILKSKHLTQIEVVATTGDLILSISDSVVIEVYITSSVYESYSFGIDNKRYIGCGSGQIAVYNN